MTAQTSTKVRITHTKHGNHDINRCVYKGDAFVATIAFTGYCTTYGKCWHLLHNNGRVDHFRTLKDARDEALLL